MMSILLDISRDMYLSRNLVFKWGTALYFLHDLDRFSTDLDFDIKRGADEKKIQESIKSICENYWDIRDHQEKRYTLFTLLSYGNLDHNVKIEINRRGETGKSEFINFMGIELLTMNLDNMTANKFCALLGRNKIANRDIYDIHFILKNNLDIDKTVIEERTWDSFETHIKKCIQFLEELWENYNILDGLWEVLDANKKQDIKKNLVKETIFLLHSLL